MMWYRVVQATFIALVVVNPGIARGDEIDEQIWDNHIEQIQQMSDAQQYRRTMNRAFDRMPSFAGAGGGAAGPSAAQQTAAWHAALTVPAVGSTHELDLFLSRLAPEMRGPMRQYLLERLTAFPREAAASYPALDPDSVVDARLFALQTAYKAVRPNASTSGAATLLLSVALSGQMTDAFAAHSITASQRADARDYYVLAAAFFAPAVRTIPGTEPIDTASRRRLAAAARSFFQRDTAIDPLSVTWEQLPCIGVPAVECQVHNAMARKIFPN